MSAFEKEYYEADSFWSDGAVLDHGNINRLTTTAKLIPAGVETLLDVGCGNGVFAKVLRSERPDVSVTGMDRSTTALKYAEGQTLAGCIDQIPAPSNSFDCVSCLQVLEHLPITIYTDSLTEIARVAKNHIVIGVPYNERFWDNTTTCPECRTTFNVDLHLRSFDKESMSNLLSHAGFRCRDMAFPSECKRPLGHSIYAAMRGKVARLRRSSAFLAPICPLCGYSEGDVTAISTQKRRAESNGKPTHRSRCLRLFKHPLSAFVSACWPKRVDHGYWIVCVYERTAGVRCSNL